MSEDADEVRRKRIQKLQAKSSPVSTSITVPVASSASTSTPGTPGTPSPIIEKQQNSNVEDHITEKPSSATPSMLTMVPDSHNPQVSRSDRSTAATVPIYSAKPSTTISPAAAKPVISFKEWQHKTIQDILQVSLLPEGDDAKESRVLLEAVANDLIEEDAEMILTTDLLDRVFWCRLTEQKCLPSTFDYLLGCWTRAANAKRLLKPKLTASATTPPTDNESKLVLLNEIQRFAVDFAVISATADASEEESGLYSNVGERLVAKASSNRSPLPWDFVQAMIVHAEEQDLSTVLISGIFTYLSTALAKATVVKPPDGMALNAEVGTAYDQASISSGSLDYRPYFTVVENLIAMKPVAATLTSIETFQVPADITSASDIAAKTILGPFLSASPVDAPSCLRNFPNPDLVSQPEIERVAVDIRAELKVIRDRLFFICDKIVRSSPVARQRLLEYFGKIVDHNHKRTAMQVDSKTVSSNGFMMNITYVLSKFCEPFVDLYGSKLDKINVDYFRRKPLFDISEETKLASDIQASKNYYAEAAAAEAVNGGVSGSGGDVNFISHIFFLTAAYFHYGLCGTIQASSRLKHIIEDIKQQVVHFEGLLPRYENGPRINLVKQALDNARSQLKQAQALRLSVQCILYDVEQQKIFVELAIFQLMFLVRAASATTAPSSPTSSSAPKLVLPFPNKTGPDTFINYPEYLIEAPISLILNVSKYLPNVLARNPNVQLVIFCITFLSNTSYIKNPYLKSKLVEVLFYGSIDYQSGQRGYFVDVFDSEPLCHKHLLHSLMNYYIEVEQTGTSSQFYDKFNTRYYISQIIKCIWANNIYRTNLEKESLEDQDFFIHFVALLLNDATYLLDESLTKLGEIHKLQKELATYPAPGLPGYNIEEPQEIQEKRGQLEAAEKHASSYMQLTNQTVLLLKLFTSAVAKAFVTPEIVDRFAAMLNYNLAALVGPKCRELKVLNPEKYGFNPRELLSQLMDVYLNLKTEASFVRAVARDGRSYNPENFDRAISILGRWGLRQPVILKSLSDLKEETERLKSEDEQGEMELGDIPDEFLDPLMYTLMEEPVILPSSHVTIDLGTIKSHLLSDAKDPFNRAPLTIDEVVPNVDLKEKIEAFKKEQREKFRASKMDTTE